MILTYLCSIVLCLSWLWGLLLLMLFFDLYKQPEDFHKVRLASTGFHDWQSVHDTPTQVLAVLSPYKTEPLPKVMLVNPRGKYFLERASMHQQTDKRPAVWRNVL